MTREMLLGFDIGGTTSTALLGDEQGRVIARFENLTRPERGPEAVVEELLDGAEQLLRHQGRVVVSCGVSIGGLLDTRNGVVLEPRNLPGWVDFPLKERLEEQLRVPVAVEHDAAACALAEHRWGAGRGISRLAHLTCGSGFGVGLVFDGEAYHGAEGLSLELGHVRYRDDGPTAFGKQGCFEAYAAGNSLPQLAAALFPQRWGDLPPNSKELSALAAANDDDARAVIESNAIAVGEACALLGDLLFLELITLGSLARYLGEPWLEKVNGRFVEQVNPAVAQRCRVEPAGLQERLPDCSALVVAVRAKESQD